MLKLPLTCAALLLASSVCGASTCEAIRAQIDSKIHAAGVRHHTLTTIDAAAKADRRVVGLPDS